MAIEMELMHSRNHTEELCHPYLRSSFKTTPVCEPWGDHCLQKTLPCNSCCVPDYGQQTFGKCAGKDLHYEKESSSRPENTDTEQHLHCVAHSCPLGKIVCCNRSDGCDLDKDIIKAVDVCSPPQSDRDRLENQTDKMERMNGSNEKECCAKKTSWTEPRICRCDLSDPSKTSKCCECECGATIVKPKKKEKRVRFEDQVATYIDCDQAFRNLDEKDIKELCRCCKECAVKGQDQCIGRPILVYELPEPKFEDKSVTHKDFCWQKTPQREVPPWHPNIKDRWRHMEVPSLSETTYQSDFKPPAVFQADRKPVYLAPQREEKRDPCQQLAEEYSAFKKTSTGPSHVYHSSCDKCDEDLHRVHLHECEASNLPPQYQCHGDGHICEPKCPTDARFTLCEAGDAEKSKYWWQRSCCQAGNRDISRFDLPPGMMEPACPGYTTSYKHDYKDPKKLHNEKRFFENCSACDYCKRDPNQTEPTMLCTKDPRLPLITERGGIA